MKRSVFLIGLLGCVSVIWPSLLIQAKSVREMSSPAAEERDAGHIANLIELAEQGWDTPDRVVVLVTDALELLARYPSIPLEIRARVAWSRALEMQSDYVSAREQARLAEGLARTIDREDLLARSLTQAGIVEFRASNFADSLIKAERALALQQSRSPSLDLFRTLTLVGASHQSLSDYGAAMENYLKSLRISEALGDTESIARAHNNIGLVHWELGQFDSAYDAFRRSFDLHERAGSTQSSVATLTNLGLILIELDRPEEALPYLSQALHLDLVSGNRYGQAKDYSNFGYAHEKLGNLEKAFGYHERALEIRRAIGDRDGVVRTSSVIGDLHLQQGNIEKALEIYVDALSLARDINEQRDVSALLESLSRARAAHGDYEGALDALREFHAIESELVGAETNRRVALLEADYHAEKQQRELALVQTLADVRNRQFLWSIAGSLILVFLTLGLGVLYRQRSRTLRSLAETETRYRAVFQQSMTPTLLVDYHSRRLIDMNPPARALCRDAAPEIGLSIEETLLEWVYGLLEPVFVTTTGDELQFEDNIEGENGARYWAEVRSSAVTVSGRSCRLISVRDITELQAEKEARQRATRLESLGVFAGGIAHDFNNALTAIVGHVELARMSDGADREHMLQRAERAAMGASGLTQQLLAFAKGGEPVRKLVDVAPLLRDSVDLADPSNSLKIQVVLEDSLWHAALDADQFRQVVTNLVVNAQHAAGPGGSLLIHASNFIGVPPGAAMQEPARYVRIDFSDDGQGVPDEIRAHVFDPYFTTKAGGIGLGLATAYTICINHGGVLELQPEAKHGATFSAFFPASEDRAEREAPLTEVEPDGHGHILVLEDDPLVSSVVCRMLKDWGYEVDAVESGMLAVEQYRTRLESGRPYDLLIMDLTMPGGIGGREAFARILDIDPGARAIVASGYSDDPTMAHFQQAGFAAALAKPFRKADLARVLVSVLQSHRNRSLRIWAVNGVGPSLHAVVAVVIRE